MTEEVAVEEVHVALRKLIKTYTDSIESQYKTRRKIKKSKSTEKPPDHLLYLNKKGGLSPKSYLRRFNKLASYTNLQIKNNINIDSKETKGKANTKIIYTLKKIPVPDIYLKINQEKKEKATQQKLNDQINQALRNSRPYKSSSYSKRLEGDEKFSSILKEMLSSPHKTNIPPKENIPIEQRISVRDRYKYLIENKSSAKTERKRHAKSADYLRRSDFSSFDMTDKLDLSVCKVLSGIPESSINELTKKNIKKFDQKFKNELESITSKVTLSEKIVPRYNVHNSASFSVMMKDNILRFTSFPYIDKRSETKIDQEVEKEMNIAVKLGESIKMGSHFSEGRKDFTLSDGRSISISPFSINASPKRTQNDFASSTMSPTRLSINQDMGTNSSALKWKIASGVRKIRASTLIKSSKSIEDSIKKISEKEDSCSDNLSIKCSPRIPRGSELVESRTSIPNRKIFNTTLYYKKLETH